MPHVLLIEDEAAIADAVLYALRSEGFEATHCLLGSAGLARFGEGGIDLVVLDVGLPDRNGFDVCRELRKSSDVPVIFLTARDGEIDRVVGFELGADDYVVKPFSPRELIARVRARLRRNPARDAGTAAADEWKRCGAFEHDAAGRRIRYAGQILSLTRYEYGVLCTLLARPGAIFSRAQLMDAVWTDAVDSADRTVDAHIKTLRAKLHAVRADADPLCTHRGVGYSVFVEMERK
ncbi:MAG TPA: two-component system response regulator CreB [Xanthomonadaceae bacterium]|nr:two-component system response regulator CreB [Xanthomonadaceae bacterium]